MFHAITERYRFSKDNLAESEDIHKSRRPGRLSRLQQVMPWNPQIQQCEIQDGKANTSRDYAAVNFPVDASLSDAVMMK
jgi:hypothetical protein